MPMPGNFLRRSTDNKQLGKKKLKFPNTCHSETERWNLQSCLQRRPIEVHEIC